MWMEARCLTVVVVVKQGVRGCSGREVRCLTVVVVVREEVGG